MRHVRGVLRWAYVLAVLWFGVLWIPWCGGVQEGFCIGLEYHSMFYAGTAAYVGEPPALGAWMVQLFVVTLVFAAVYYIAAPGEEAGQGEGGSA